MELKTAKGNLILFKDYITGRDMNAYKQVQFANMKVSNVHGEMVPEMSTNIMLELERKGLELTIVSLNGETVNPVEKVLDLELSEYEEVVNEMNTKFFFRK
jgi:translation initiation factor IF-3